MKKLSKKLKGMTLVELVVAIAILGYASLMLAVALAQVAAINKENHQFNERMSNQVKIAENASDTASGVTVTENEIRLVVTNRAGFTSGTYKMTGDSCYVDVAGTTDVSGNDRDATKADFKYYNVLIPPKDPSAP